MFINENVGRHGPPKEVVNIPLDSKVKKAATNKLWITWFLYSFVGMWIGTEIVAAMLGFPKVKMFSGELITQYVYNPWACIWPWGKLVAMHLPAAIHANVMLAFYAGWGATVAISVGALVLARGNAHYHISNAPRAIDWQGGAHWARPEEIGASGLLPPNNWAHKAGMKLKIAAAKANKKNPPSVPKNAKEAAEEYRQWQERPAIFVGEWYDKKTKKKIWMRDDTDRHFALFAPTRGGKGIGIIIPTCLTWTQSLVVNDPKGELYDNTAGFRKFMGQRIFKFDPICNDGTSARINVLDFVRLKTDFEVADAQNIAKMVCDPQGVGLDTGSDSDHWRKTAYSFLTGVILHLLYKYDAEREAHELDNRSRISTRPNMAGVDDFLSNPASGDEKNPDMALYSEMKNFEHDPMLVRGWYDAQNRRSATCPEAAKAGQDMASRPDGERGSVLSSVKSYLDLYRDPTIARNTATSDFSFEDLMYAKQAATLYLINNPNNMERVRPLMRLIVNVLMTTFTGSVEFDDEGRQKNKYQNKMLILMDEFTSTLGKMSIFANAISFVAGYGIKVMIVVQDLVQLKATYGESDAEALASNVHTRIMYATNNPSTAQSLSSMLGSETVRQESVSHNGGKKSVSESFIARNLLTASDFAALPDTDEVIMVTGNAPIYAKKIKYFEEPFFKSRGKKHFKPPARSDRILSKRDYDTKIAKGGDEAKEAKTLGLQTYYLQIPELVKAAKVAADMRITERTVQAKQGHSASATAQQDRARRLEELLPKSATNPSAGGGIGTVIRPTSGPATVVDYSAGEEDVF